MLDEVQTKLGSDFVSLSRDAYTAAALLDIPPEELDQGFMALLRTTAEASNTSPEAVAHTLLHRELEDGENEITNRINILPRLQELLQGGSIDV